jgi:hypothetical protein
MRLAALSLAIVGAFSCGNPSEPDSVLILETDQSSYVATDDPDPRFDHSARVIVKFRNESSVGIVRIYRCTATTTFPPYTVEPDGGGQAAWNPDIACATNAPYRDVAANGELTDTLLLRSPWQRLFNGQPVGVAEGNFRLFYEVQICGRVINQNGFCMVNRFEYVRSNRFTIHVP